MSGNLVGTIGQPVGRAVDEGEIRRGLDLLWMPGEVHELRAPNTARATISGYYTNIDAMVRDVLDLERLRPAGIYRTINPVAPELLARASNRLEFYAKHSAGDADIPYRRWFPIDLDAVRVSGISATDSQHEAAIERARRGAQMFTELFGFPAALIADSGNGGHLLWAVDLPNDDASRELLKRALEGAAALLDDDAVKVDKSVFNAARIWKLYGTVSRKGDNLPERPHRMARLLEAPEFVQIVTREQLERLCALAPEPKPQAQNNGHAGAAFDLEGFIRRNPIEVKRAEPWFGGTRYILQHCVFDSTHGGTSAAILQFPSGAIAYKCQHNGCVDRKWRDLRALYESRPDASQHSPGAESGADESQGFKFTRVGDMVDEPQEAHEWVWEETLIEGGVSLWVAKPKVGKSTTARNLALKIARGAPFLDRATKKGAVVYLELEEKRSQVRKHFKAMGVSRDEDIFIHTGPAPGKDVLVYLRSAIKKHRACLAVVDPLFKLIRIKDGNDYAEVTRALEPLMIIARETNCHILLIHHFGKGDREAGDQILGSTAMFAAVDTALFMRKREHYRTLTSTQRYGTDIEGLALTFDKETGLVVTSGSIEELEMTRATQAISAFMEAQNEWVSQADIRDCVEGVRTAIMVHALQQGVKRGDFKREGDGKKGNPYVYQTILFASSHIYTGTREPESQKRQKKPADVKQNAGSQNSGNGKPREPASNQHLSLRPESGELQEEEARGSAEDDEVLL